MGRASVASSQNLVTYSDPDTVGRYGAASNISVGPYVWTGVPWLNLVNATEFADNTVTRLGYKNVLAFPIGVTVYISAYVELYSGLAPVQGSTIATSDITLIAASAYLTSLNVEHVAGAVYRVSKYILMATAGSLYYGVVKVNTNLPGGFRASGIQVVQANWPGPYQPTLATPVNTGPIRNLALVARPALTVARPALTVARPVIT